MVKKFCIKEFKNFFHSTTQKFEHVYVTIKESKFFNTLLLEELLDLLESHELHIKKFDYSSCKQNFQVTEVILEVKMKDDHFMVKNKEAKSLK